MAPVGHFDTLARTSEVRFPASGRKRGAPQEVAFEYRSWKTHAADVAATAGSPRADGFATDFQTWLLDDVAWAVLALGALPADATPSDHSAMRTVRRALDLLLEAVGTDPYLLGGAVSELDLAAAAVFAPVARPESWRWATPAARRGSGRAWPTLFFQHPAAAWVRRIYDRHGASTPAAPPAFAWIP